MTKKYLKQCLLVVGLFLSSSCLYGQSPLKNLQEIQFLSQNTCVVVQINADWNIKASIDFTGGTVINFNINKDVYNPEFDLRTYLKDNIDESVSLVEVDSKDGIQSLVITTQFLKDESLVSSVLENKYKNNFTIEKIESIGPKIGKEFSLRNLANFIGV